VPILLDTGILYAYYDRSDAWHERAAALVNAERGGLLVPGPVIPEVDHLLGRRLGREARHLFYQGLAEGGYLMVDLPQEAVRRVDEINRRFPDLDLGYVDAAIVALAESLGVKRIGTTDRRDFEPLGAALALEILPVPAR